MYQIENTGQVLRSRLGASGRGRRVSRNVLFLGLTSLLTDVSAEMLATVLPLYLLLGLRVTPLQLGLIDGLYQGASVLVRVASGVVADRWRHPKEVALAGYGLSAVTRLGFIAVTGPWSAIAALVAVDRVGKGIRTAPRDALISLSTTPARLATAFGVHRSLDTAGAMMGPLVAFGILLLAPGAFDAVFVVSLCFAVAGVAVLAFLVRAPRRRVRRGSDEEQVSLRAMVAMVGSRPFLALVVVATALGVATISDGLLYLALQQRIGFNVALFPLLFVGTALSFMVLAVPVGRVADRLGRGRIFVLGYGVLAAAYGILLLPPFGAPQVLLFVGLLGVYYAMTEGVLMAIASTIAPAHLRASGLGFVATASSLARLVASVLFGAIWTFWTIEVAIGAFLVLLTITASGSAAVFPRWWDNRRHAD